VRASLAESEDAFRAASQVGVADREEFRNALRLTLVKEEHHIPPFDRLFPLYFGADEPPAMDDALGGMGGEDAERLREALKKLAEMLGPEVLRRLLEHLLKGRPLSRQEMDALGREAGLPMAGRPSQAPWMESRMKQTLGLDEMMQAVAAGDPRYAKWAQDGWTQEMIVHEMQRGIMQAKRTEITVWSLSDIGVDPSEVGAAGAKERVVSFSPREPRKGGQVVQDEGDAATKITEFLTFKKVL